VVPLPRSVSASSTLVSPLSYPRGRRAGKPRVRYGNDFEEFRWTPPRHDQPPLTSSPFFTRFVLKFHDALSLLSPTIAHVCLVDGRGLPVWRLSFFTPVGFSPSLRAA